MMGYDNTTTHLLKAMTCFAVTVMLALMLLKLWDEPVRLLLTKHFKRQVHRA